MQNKIDLQMWPRYWILLALLLAVAYASSEHETLKNSRKQTSNRVLVRQKRFLLPTAILAGKALLGTAAFGLGLTHGALYVIFSLTNCFNTIFLKSFAIFSQLWRHRFTCVYSSRLSCVSYSLCTFVSLR